MLVNENFKSLSLRGGVTVVAIRSLSFCRCR